ncbi:MAG: hypothetical protein D6160_08520 [Ketobacter sp.]|nr:MAG: hypothetical protein D6160_08520 [Ketobacter sp.]
MEIILTGFLSTWLRILYGFGGMSNTECIYIQAWQGSESKTGVWVSSAETAVQDRKGQLYLLFVLLVWAIKLAYLV